MDLHQLDVLIDEAGHLPSEMNAAIVSALASGVPFSALQPVLGPLDKLSKALQKIQQWSDAAKPQPSTQKPIQETEATPMLTARANEPLPRLTGDRFVRMVKLQRTAKYDSVLAAALGDRYNAYVNEYSAQGHYWKDVLNAPR